MIMENISLIIGICAAVVIIGYVNYKSIIARSQRIIKKISKLTKN